MGRRRLRRRHRRRAFPGGGEPRRDRRRASRLFRRPRGVTSAPSRSVALALGGARGLAHIPMLEVFDELGIAPVAIAGTSMGAIFGAAYASGLSGREIRET